MAKLFENTWEDQISMNTRDNSPQSSLGPPSDYYDADSKRVFNLPDIDFLAAAERDTFPLPPSGKIREGYYGENHYAYWLSGLRDYHYLKSVCDEHGIGIESMLDLGCSSGRVIRHFSAQSDCAVYGADINWNSIRWIYSFLDPSIIAFQNTSIPHLPIQDNKLSLVTAFSVFTHIECFDMAWMMEIHRILKPGGMAFITIKSEYTLKNMTPSWITYNGLKAHPDFTNDMMGSDMTEDRLIFRYRGHTSYSSQVFLHTDYVRRIFGRIFDIIKIDRMYPEQQDSIFLRKK